MNNCFFKIPFEGKYIAYRPLRHAAFICNDSMAVLTARLVNDPDTTIEDSEREAAEFLRNIGYLLPDPPPPARPEQQFNPQTLVLLLTNRCNLRCRYCYADAGEKSREDMPEDLIIRAVDAVAQNAEDRKLDRFELVFHGGGEPVVHWSGFTTAVERAKSKKQVCGISMSSNGIWNDKQTEYILENLNGVSLSFDGTREVQEAQRPMAGGGSSFGAAMRTIAILDDKKFPYNIRMTISTPWLDRLPECIEFICKETGCRSIQVEPAFGEGREGWRNPDRDAADRFIRAYIEALNIAEDNKKDLMYSGARPWMTVCTFCSAPDSALVLRADGTLVACYEITDSRHELADIFTIGYFSKNGPEFDKAARDRFDKMRQERLAICQDCYCLWHCAGDCSSRAFGPTPESHLRQEQRCHINRELTKEYLARYIERSDGVWISKVTVSSENEPEKSGPCEECDRECE